MTPLSKVDQTRTPRRHRSVDSSLRTSSQAFPGDRQLATAPIAASSATPRQQIPTPSRFPVATHLIISNRRACRLETHLTPPAAIKRHVLIDTNVATVLAHPHPPHRNEPRAPRCPGPTRPLQ